MKYEPVIGLEIHAQLKTKSKMFCGCDNDAEGKEPNSVTCPVCMGMPGTLPVINKKALEWTYLLGLALNCKPADQFNFERKQYFYPDLPKGYQITSQTTPPLIGGYLDFPLSSTSENSPMLNLGRMKRFTIEHIHLEEDAGKLIHKNNYSLVDLNRAGTPLLEIVTNPDFRNPAEAKEFTQELQLILRYLGISDADMEKGQLRVDANISLRKKGEKKLGKKTEIKNMNSFASLEKALKYEIERQTEILENRGEIEQETRGWDEDKQKTISQRTKEYAHDYRYFPEPDLPPIIPQKAFDLLNLLKKIPELPLAKSERYQKDFGLDKKSADILVSDSSLASYFEEAILKQDKKIIKKIANWILTEVLRHLKESNMPIADFTTVEPGGLRELVLLIEKGEITSTIAKDIFSEMIKTGEEAKEIIAKKGIKQVKDKGELEGIVKDIIEANSVAVEDYKKGKKESIKFLIGKVMKETRGQANAEVVGKILEKMLGNL